MALLLWPDASRRDGSEGLAARRPATTRGGLVQAGLCIIQITG